MLLAEFRHEEVEWGWVMTNEASGSGLDCCMEGMCLWKGREAQGSLQAVLINEDVKWEETCKSVKEVCRRGAETARNGDGGSALNSGEFGDDGATTFLRRAGYCAARLWG